MAITVDGNLKLNRWQRRMLLETARTYHRLLAQAPFRIVRADFNGKDGEVFVSFFATGKRAIELRTLIDDGFVATDEPVCPDLAKIYPDESDIGVIELASRSIYRLLRKRNRNLFTVDFAEEDEPTLLVYARGETAEALRRVTVFCRICNA